MSQREPSAERDRLNPSRVTYYRRVLNGLSYLDHAEVKKRLQNLRALAVKLDDQIREFNEATEYFVRAGVGNAPEGLVFSLHRVSERPEAWMTARAPVDWKASKEEWSVRPTTPAALEAWNCFAAGLQKEPIRIYRISAKRDNQWEAEYRRPDGSPMFLSLSDLTADEQRDSVTEGMFFAESFVTIVDGMLQWIEAEAPPIALHLVTKRDEP